MGPDWPLRRWRIDYSGPQVETRGVQRAFHLTALQPAFGQRRVLVGAGVVHSEELTIVGVENGNRDALRIRTVKT
jgi:hypothetical protein